jgi:tetratricopeptide (TPR) repeat protein
MEHPLVKIEQEALALMNAGKFKQAAELFSEIIQSNPEYEHGMCFYNLAGCYEDLGEYEKAGRCYRRALQYAPNDQTRLGGYASFLYLHGDPAQALDVYLSLFRLELSSGNRTEAERTKLAIKDLANRIGLADEALAEKMKI